MISREDAIELNDNENFIGDIIGCRVVSKLGDDLGVVKDVILTGANDVYMVKNGDKEYMIPVIDDCIHEVDIENKIIIATLLKGLIE